MEDLGKKLISCTSLRPNRTKIGIVSNNKNHHVAIIGGGYAGMAAAVTLAAANVPVTVFESARQLGGRARGVWHNNVQLDNGQHILLGCYHHTLQLIEQIGGNV